MEKLPALSPRLTPNMAIFSAGATVGALGRRAMHLPTHCPGGLRRSGAL
jgi:hypothetical protein